MMGMMLLPYQWMPLLFLSLALTSVLPVADAFDKFINAGAQETYIDSLGNEWEPDAYYTFGRSYRTWPSVPIAATEEDELYLTGRYTDPADPPMVYDIPLQEGRYRVIMHFTDTYGPTSEPNKRIFNVFVESKIAFPDVDIVKEAGGPRTALQKSMTTYVDDGSLTIEFESKVQNAALSAIEIHSVQENLTPLFINAGGDDFVDSYGNEWKSDAGYYNIGRAFTRNELIIGTSKQQLYQSQRYLRERKRNIMRYEVPVLSPGTYDVYFHFCDTSQKINGAGQRLFNVRAEGIILFRDLDVFDEAGGIFMPLVKKATIEVADSMLTIDFERNVRNPLISGLEVHRVVQASPPGFLTAPSMQPTFEPDTFEPIRINCGGSPNYTDTRGNEWVSDEVVECYNTGLTFSKPVPIEGTEDDLIYQSERWDVFNGPPMTYDIPVPNGVYDIFLHFTEIFSKAQAPNQRVFDVYIEDELIYEDLDIFKEVGGYNALVKKSTSIVTDGALTIRFRHKIRDPKICGIEILLAPPSSAPSMAPSISASPTGPTFSPVPSDVPSVAPSMYPTETLLPWIDLDEDESYIARHECSFVQAGDKFYLFGGRENPSQVDIYDYTNDTWSQGSPAPKPFNHFQAQEHEGLIWVIGSFESNDFPDEIPTNNVYVYDPAADVWMIGPSITWPRGAGGLVVYKDMFYLLGGNNAGHDGGFVPWFDRYDPRTGEWRLLRDAPHARDHFNSVVINNKLYAAGGRRTIRGNTLGDTVKEVDVYDFESGEWLAEDALPRDLPLPRASAAAAAFDGKILLMGGETRENPEAFDRVDSLDPETGRWSTLMPMNHKRHGMQAIVSGDGIFVAAGSPRRGGGQQRNMEVYNENAPVGVRSSAGILGLLFGGASSVTIQHIGGNEGVFVNSIVVEGPSANDFVIKNRTTSRFLIPKNGSFEIHFEYKGTPGQEVSAEVVVTYTVNKKLRITLLSATT